MGNLTKNFSQSEVACKCGKCKGRGRISPSLMKWLQDMRDDAGPIRITSGVRCQQHPETKKRPTSSHVPRHLDDLEGRVGHAVDIATMGSGSRYRLLAAAFGAGVHRIGVGKDFLHLDNDKTKVPCVIWDYYD